MKATPMIVHASGHSFKITRAAAADIIRKSRVSQILRGEIRRNGDVYQIGHFGIEITRPATTAPLPLDFFSAIKLAARAFGVPEYRLYDVVVGWRESASLIMLWNQWLKANPQFIPAVTA